MAKNRSALKRVRLARIRQLRNKARKSAMKTAIKKFESALAAGDRARAEAALRAALRIIDKVASKGTIHPNKRDRKKARLARKFQNYFKEAASQG